LNEDVKAHIKTLTIKLENLSQLGGEKVTALSKGEFAVAKKKKKNEENIMEE
jgi:hypothetical protein